MQNLQHLNEILSVLLNKQSVLDNDTINKCIGSLTAYKKNTNISSDEDELLQNIIRIIQKI